MEPCLFGLVRYVQWKNNDNDNDNDNFIKNATNVRK